MAEPRKKSPRAPSMPLDEALDRVAKAYEKDRLHASPTEVFAKHIGYNSANNGAALSALASLRYYGLVERPRDGMLAVAKDFEAFRFAPSEELRQSFLKKFLRSPPLFAELLDTYQTGLPSESTLKYELIQRGFLPQSATALVAVIKRSIEFTRYFESLPSAHAELSAEPAVQPSAEVIANRAASSVPAAIDSHTAPQQVRQLQGSLEPPWEGAGDESSSHDRIPVRLPGGRRAWLVIPSVFYESDKIRIKAQVDLLLTEDEE